MDFLNGYHPNCLDETFFSVILKKIDPEAKLLSFKHLTLDSSDSILSTLAGESTQERNSFLGFSRFKLIYESHGSKCVKNIVIKSKAPSGFMKNIVLGLGKPAGPEMEALFAEHCEEIGPGHTEHKEIEMYKLDVVCFKEISPEVYFTFKDASKDVYFIVLEDLGSDKFELTKTISEVEQWTETDFVDALEGLAKCHAYFMDSTEKIPLHLKQWLAPKVTTESMSKKKPFLLKLLEHNSYHVPELFTPALSSLLRKAVKNCEAIYDILYSVPYTLIHDDATPRNMCMRKVSTGNHKRLCLYDWEIARESNNLRDIVDFLANALPRNASPELWTKYRDIYHHSLVRSLEVLHNSTEDIQNYMSDDKFRLVFDMAVVDCLIDRYGFYMFSYVYRKLVFFPRVMENIIAYVVSIEGVLHKILQ